MLRPVGARRGGTVVAFGWTSFGWTAGSDPPARWDLRRTGWELVELARAEVWLIDAGALAADGVRAFVEAEREKPRLVLLGVEDPAERAALLALGCGEALGSAIGLAELDIRARRLARLSGLVARLREAGPLTLDLVHRDGRVGDNWLALHPREFGLIWRLAEHPGRAVTRPELLRDVWRLRHEPETNSVQVHVSRLRTKLAAHGLRALVASDPGGGYRLAPWG